MLVKRADDELRVKLTSRLAQAALSGPPHRMAAGSASCACPPARPRTARGGREGPPPLPKKKRTRCAKAAGHETIGSYRTPTGRPALSPAGAQGGKGGELGGGCAAARRARCHSKKPPRSPPDSTGRGQGQALALISARREIFAKRWFESADHAAHVANASDITPKFATFPECIVATT